MRILTKIAFLTFTVVCAAATAVVPLPGDWRGDSICRQKNTSCHDEKVVYHVPAPDSAGKVTINAGRIVDRKPIDMGPVTLIYDKTKHTLDGIDGPRVWHFDVDGKTMSGTLTISGTQIRKVDLRKD